MSSARQLPAGRLCGLGIAVLAVALAVLPGCGAKETPEEAVASSFRRFVEALADGDGNDAADELSYDTLDLFQEALDRAVEDDLSGASPSMRLAVHAARVTWTESQLRDMDGRELCEDMVEQKWVAPYTDKELVFQVIEVDGDEATLAIGAPEEPRRPRLQAVEENGAWKLDLAASRRDADGIAGDVFRYGAASEEETVRMILGR